MKDLLQHIHVFRTNIREENLHEIKKLFSRNKAIRQWNVDTEDCDLVLRVVSPTLSEHEIMATVLQHGFECSDLA